MPTNISTPTFENWQDLTRDSRHLAFVHMHQLMLATRIGVARNAVNPR